MAYDVIPYWYSDSTTISSFQQTTVDFKHTIYSNCDMTTTNYNNYMTHAMNEWDDTFSVDFNNVTSNEDVSAGCISRENANDLSIPSNVVGFAGTGSLTYSARYRKPDFSGYVTFYTHTSAEVYVIWDDDGTDGTVQTSNFTTTQWENVFTHEMGHVMGFKGHNIMGSTQLMHPYTNNVTTIQYYDEEQMKLVYGLE